jgi:hypothetical protein
MAADACLKCAAPLKRPDVGRPPAYCSPACRRAAEYELERLQRRLEKLETYAADLRLMGDPDRQARKVDQELEQAERRLRELLAGQVDPEVSPASAASGG